MKTRISKYELTLYFSFYILSHPNDLVFYIYVSKDAINYCELEDWTSDVEINELEDWTSDVEINENIFDIDEDQEENDDEVDGANDLVHTLACSPLPAAIGMLDDLWCDDDQPSDDDENYDQEYTYRQVDN